MTITAHIDRQHMTIDGVTFKNTYSGQKRAYGDSYYEYEVESALPPDEVERVCAERVYKAMPKAVYDAECKAKPSLDNAFRPFYTFKKTADGKYFYQVTFLYAD